VIVASPALRDKRQTSALTYVEIGFLTREVIFGAAEQFPASLELIQHAAMQIAMQRAIVVVSEFVKVAKSGAAAALPMFQTLGAENVFKGDKEEVDGAAIIPMITGNPLKEPEEVEEEEELDSADLPALFKSKISTLEEKVDAKVDALDAKVGTLQKGLDEVLVLLKAKS